jgi:hypothetical protein
MRRVLEIVSATVLAFCPLVASGAGPSRASFNVPVVSEIPGQLLQPGNYTIQVIGQLADRVILRVDDASKTFHVDFIGIPSRDLKATSPIGLALWTSSVKGVSYYRSWRPSGNTTALEFVYPKAEAVSLAKVNQTKVAAIDPASEGMHVDPTLSADDMKLVTLWLLSSTRVGPDNTTPDIKAERYETASLTPPKQILQRLPHTASGFPVLLLITFVSLSSALVLRRQRRIRQA